MEFNNTYLVLAVFVLGMNIIPALMPPTWMVLAFFFIHFNLSLIPTVLIGVIFAALGRVILATLSRFYFRKLFSIKSLANYDALGKFFNKHQKFTIPIILIYAFLPIPSNQVFIMVGLTELNLKVITFSFFIGRLISYTFWVNLADIAADKLEMIFSRHFASSTTFVVELVGLGVIYLIGRINWKRVLRK